MGVALAIAVGLFPILAFAQAGRADTKLRLLCEGARETGYLLDDRTKKREEVTIQVTIFLPSGFFEAEGLTLQAYVAQRRGATPYTPPRFIVNAESFYFQVESSTDSVSQISKFTIDRYSAIAREAQSIIPSKFPDRHLVISGEYRCKQLDKPIF